MDDEMPQDVLENNLFPESELVKTRMSLAYNFMTREQFESALGIYKDLLTNVSTLIGPNNGVTFFIKFRMGLCLYKQAKYKLAMSLFNELYKKQVKHFGHNDGETLSTRGMIALVLHRQGENQESLKLFREVIEKQTELLGPNHKDTLLTKSSMVTALMALGHNEEALVVNRELLQSKRELLGDKSLETLAFQNNMALALTNGGQYKEAIDLFQDVFVKRKKILGMRHSDTLRPLHNIANVYHAQGDFESAEQNYLDTLKKQKKNLGTNHIDTLRTQLNYGNLLFQMGRLNSQMKLHQDTVEKMKVLISPDHPDILRMEKMIATSQLMLGSDPAESADSLLKRILGSTCEDLLDKSPENNKNIFHMVKMRDEAGIKKFVEENGNVNERDNCLRSPLHYAVYTGHQEIVSTLIQGGANLLAVSDKGNTVLHLAASINNSSIISFLLNSVAVHELDTLINAKTSLKQRTALHEVAKNGNYEVLKMLLKQGAVFNFKDIEGKEPKDLATCADVISLLHVMTDLFGDAKDKPGSLLNKLTLMKETNPDEVLAMLKGRNSSLQTIIQVTLINKHKDTASSLLELLRTNY